MSHVQVVTAAVEQENKISIITTAEVPSEIKAPLCKALYRQSKVSVQKNTWALKASESLTAAAATSVGPSGKSSAVSLQQELTGSASKPPQVSKQLLGHACDERHREFCRCENRMRTSWDSSEQVRGPMSPARPVASADLSKKQTQPSIHSYCLRIKIRASFCQQLRTQVVKDVKVPGQRPAYV
ncbi:hypothetical protein UY3_18790 [Chelonia mydas]|uniref:Uncharacterized protein n=1 Tax=Chelonia mydas TaxID=8469 RepID=M7AWJ0_CHEMY|nr:hypothetical protein UY3_18790 [Chelonia mydas]